MCRATRRHHAARKKAPRIREAYERDRKWANMMPRYGCRARPEYKEKWWRQKYIYWMTTPSAWTRIMMNRPHRAKEHAALKKVLKGDLDAQFPVWGKPHIYYW